MFVFLIEQIMFILFSSSIIHNQIVDNGILPHACRVNYLNLFILS